MKFDKSIGLWKTVISVSLTPDIFKLFLHYKLFYLEYLKVMLWFQVGISTPRIEESIDQVNFLPKL